MIAQGDAMKEARFWSPDDGRVQCHLCPHNCRISEGKTGICGVRENRDDQLMSLIYGRASSAHPDPIEKKPLYHFMPGTQAYSLGTVGCTFRCEHCQNYSISQADPGASFLKDTTAEQIIEEARRAKCSGLAWTYNEPTIWHEFSYHTSKMAKREGLYSVYVTNGYIQPDPLKDISEHLDAMNIDIKAFREKFYKKVCRASLQPVLDAAELAFELGIHVELTYLIIPGKNDSKEEMSEFLDWVMDRLSDQTPVHFSRFHPDYRMRDTQATPLSTMEEAYDLAKEMGLKHVYLGNVPHSDKENTYCPACGQLVIERRGFSSSIRSMKDGNCGNCGEPLNIVV